MDDVPRAEYLIKPSCCVISLGDLAIFILFESPTFLFLPSSFAKQMENEYWNQIYQREMEEKNEVIQGQRDEIQRLHRALQETSYNLSLQRAIVTYEIESKVEAAAGTNSFIRVEVVKSIVKDVSRGLVDSIGVQQQTRSCHGSKRCRDEEEATPLELPNGLRVA